MLYKVFRVNREQFMADVVRDSKVDVERRQMLGVVIKADLAGPEQRSEFQDMQASILAAMSDRLSREGFVLDGLKLRQPFDQYTSVNADTGDVELVITQGEASI